MDGMGGQEGLHTDVPRLPDEMIEYPRASSINELAAQFPETSTNDLLALQAGVITAQNNFVCDALGLTGPGKFDDLHDMGPATIEQKLKEVGKTLI